MPALTGAWLGAALAVGAVPVALFLGLFLAGELSGFLALLAGGTSTFAAMAAASLWSRDLDRLAGALDRVHPGSPPATGPKLPPPLLPPVERIARRIERLARSLEARASELSAALRANEAIIERLPDPLLVLDRERAARRSNAAARAAFGDDISAVLRHPLLREAIDRAWRERAPQTADLVLPVPVEREVQATVIYLEPRLADGAQALLVLSDRTRERAVERMRADFVTNASHELRTPLASLMGFVETLRGPAADDPPAQARFLAIMADQAERMNRLIDDLLSLSRVELSEHTPPADSVDLVALAQRVLAGFEPRVKARKVTLSLEIGPELPSVMADADQITQVLTNLIDNAVKYGREAGHVQVSLRLSPPGSRFSPRPGVVLAVRDDGPGIARAHVPRLTERFYRVDKARSRSAGGTGLGLAIVKHIINRHRGQLAIDSEEGHGAVFSVWLPLSTDT